MKVFGFIASAVLIFLALIFGINHVDKIGMRNACSVFSRESNRETKYVDYTMFRHDCLTKLDNGQWISAYNLRGN